MRKQVLQCTSTNTHLPGHINTRRELLPNGLDNNQAYIMVYVPWYQTVRKTMQKRAHISAVKFPSKGSCVGMMQTSCRAEVSIKCVKVSDHLDAKREKNITTAPIPAGIRNGVEIPTQDAGDQRINNSIQGFIALVMVPTHVGHANIAKHYSCAHAQTRTHSSCAHAQTSATMHLNHHALTWSYKYKS